MAAPEVSSAQLKIKKPIKIRDETHLRELHQQYFTASRLASLYNDGFTSRFEEFHFMRGNLPMPVLDNVMLERGRRMQALIRPWVKEKTGWEVRDTQLFFPHPTIQRFGASPDLLASRDGKRLVGEAKIVTKTAWREQWAEGTEPPLRVELQLQSQIACTKFSEGFIAALVIGEWDFELHILERKARPKTISKIERDVKSFLEDVEANREPKPDFAIDGTAIRDLHPFATSGKQIDVSGNRRIVSLCAREIELKAIEAETKAERQSVKAELIYVAKDADMILADPYIVKTHHVEPTENKAGYRKCSVSIDDLSIKESADPISIPPTPKSKLSEMPPLF